MKSKIVTLESVRVIESDGEKKVFEVPELLTIQENIINVFTKNESLVKTKNDILMIGQMCFITTDQDDQSYKGIVISCTEAQAYRNIMKIKGVLEELKTMPDEETNEKDTEINNPKIEL